MTYLSPRWVRARIPPWGVCGLVTTCKEIFRKCLQTAWFSGSLGGPMQVGWVQGPPQGLMKKPDRVAVIASCQSLHDVCKSILQRISQMPPLRNPGCTEMEHHYLHTNGASPPTMRFFCQRSHGAHLFLPMASRVGVVGIIAKGVHFF